MKRDKLFATSIVMELGGLVGILIGYFVNLLFPVVGSWIANICLIVVCIGLILSLVVLAIEVYDCF